MGKCPGYNYTLYLCQMIQRNISKLYREKCVVCVRACVHVHVSYSDHNEYSGIKRNYYVMYSLGGDISSLSPDVLDITL